VEYSIDGTDLKILGLLQANSRITNAALAVKCRMAPSAILERVKKLEHRKIIRSFGLRISPEALHLRLLAFIFIKTAEGPGNLAAGRRMARLAGVLELHHIAGEDCFLMKIRSRDPESLGIFLRQKLGRIPGIISTKTTIVLETLTENNLLPVPGHTDGK
jgi:Lrp/AsnC family leucine-responsive transcriptional regulator